MFGFQRKCSEKIIAHKNVSLLIRVCHYFYSFSVEVVPQPVVQLFALLW